jgi:hypothetical protein
MAEYVNKHNTLMGYKGEIPTLNQLEAQFDTASESKPGPPMEGAKLAPDGKYYIKKEDGYYEVTQ